MRDPLEVAAELWSLPGASRELRLVDGLAVRLRVGPTARITRDVDVVSMTNSARDELVIALERRGWHIGRLGPWIRASRAGDPLIDIASHPVMSPRTFDAVTLRGAPSPMSVGGVDVQVTSAGDLALLKLVAQRDQDLIDLYLLSSHERLDARFIADAAERDDIERVVSEGALRARHATASGRLAALVEEVTAASPSPSAMAALTGWLDALEKEGI